MDYVAGFSKYPVNNGQHNYNNLKNGNNFKIIRKKYNITQNDLANYLNTTQSTISAMNTGRLLKRY